MAEKKTLRAQRLTEIDDLWMYELQGSLGIERWRICRVHVTDYLWVLHLWNGTILRVEKAIYAFETLTSRMETMQMHRPPLMD